MISRFQLSTFALAFVSVAAAAAEAPRTEAQKLEFFEKRIRPLLADNCYACHSADTKPAGGLRVDDRNGLVHGGNRGAAVVPGQPEKSLILKAVQHLSGAPKMPPEAGKLTESQVADLRQWIRDGASWPAAVLAEPLNAPNEKYAKLRKEHWAWQPILDQKPPVVKNAGWPRSDVDRFVLAMIEQKGLMVVGDADRVSLLRRVTFDLIGLPPKPEEIDAFVNDGSADAFEKVVDRLLASRAYAERWGRHWLDVARYGESTGSSRNLPYPHAWRYRDYVIDAVARDVPFDRFLTEQIAGDLLQAPTQKERDRNVVATGFLALGVKDVNQRFKVRFVMDNVDEQIDTVTRAALGLTVSCARCHDHKFDPVPTTDYYALAGIFTSTDNCSGLRNKMGGGGLDYYDTSMLLQVGVAAKADPKQAEKIAEAKKALDKAQKEFDAIRGTKAGLEIQPNGRPRQFAFRQRLTQAQNQLLALTDVAAQGRAAFGVRDAKSVGDTEVRIRGEAEQLGPKVRRGYLTAFNVPGAAPIAPSQSGRLELAKWLTNVNNPLTSRVAANRAWHNLFGRGIVDTVDNFGVTGSAPTHPELLDYLAKRFVSQGWSVKRLVRELVLSRTYRLSSESIASNREVDPANRFLWRHSPRRLEAEEIRDATLAASGGLDPKPPVASPAKDFKVIELRNNGPEARNLEAAAFESRHRSVYLPLLRTLVPRSLEVFDFAEQGMVTGSRDATTVATQALYLLNDPFVRRESLRLAEQLAKRSDLDDAARIRQAYRLVLGRAPGDVEARRAAAFIAEYAAASSSSNPKRSAPVVVASAAPKGGKAPPAPANPDEAELPDEPQQDFAVEARDARTAAWLSFCQALFASAEFRYLQ